MATITYKCNVCSRDIDLLENSKGLSAFSKCVITYGCKGKLLKTKRNPNNIREKFPSEVSGIEDYNQRKALFTFSQPTTKPVWTINHDLNVSPAISVYVNDINGTLVSLSPENYTTKIVNKNQVKIYFKDSYKGKAQLVSRSSIKTVPIASNKSASLVQTSSNGYLVFAVPKILTRFEYPPTVLPPIQTPYDLSNLNIRIEVSIKRPNEEEEICTEFLTSSLIDTPWSGWSEVLIRRRRNYYVFAKNILDFRTFGGDNLKFSDIPDGTQLRITRVDYGTGVLQPIPQEGLYLLLSNSPYTANDKIKDKVVNLANMVDNTIDYLSFTTSDFFVDSTQIEKTYPDIIKTTLKPYIKPTLPSAPSQDIFIVDGYGNFITDTEGEYLVE